MRPEGAGSPTLFASGVYVRGMGSPPGCMCTGRGGVFALHFSCTGGACAGVCLRPAVVMFVRGSPLPGMYAWGRGHVCVRCLPGRRVYAGYAVGACQVCGVCTVCRVQGMCGYVCAGMCGRGCVCVRPSGSREGVRGRGYVFIRAWIFGFSVCGGTVILGMCFRTLFGRSIKLRGES